MQNNKILKILSIIIYIIGIMFVIVLGVKYVMHSTEILNPDAMLPVMRYELASFKIIIGTPIMFISSIFTKYMNMIKGKRNTFLILLPGIICIIISLHYIISSF